MFLSVVMIDWGNLRGQIFSRTGFAPSAGPSSEGRPGRDRTRLSLKFYPYMERGDGLTVVYAYSEKLACKVTFNESRPCVKRCFGCPRAAVWCPTPSDRLCNLVRV